MHLEYFTGFRLPNGGEESRVVSQEYPLPTKAVPGDKIGTGTREYNWAGAIRTAVAAA